MEPYDRKKLYNTALEQWGKPMQMQMVIEELSELSLEVLIIWKTAALSYGTRDIECLSEEIADVEIMLEQLGVMFNIEIIAIPENENIYDGMINIAKLTKEICKGFRGKGNLDNLRTLACKVLYYISTLKDKYHINARVNYYKEYKLNRLKETLSKCNPSNQCVRCGLVIPEGDHLCDGCKNK